MIDPQQLLTDYVEGNSDSAFRELVERYIDLVYSVALRRTNNDTRYADDIAQTVFTDLSKKAHKLPPGVLLGSWLYQHTSFVAANVLRSERRRVAREQQSIEMKMLYDDADSNWKHLAPVLDDAIQELAPSERDAVVLRFFEKRDFRSVGAALGVSDDTAQKRVSRALEKLRELLVQRGVTLGVVALGTALTDRSIQAAPAQLSSAITGSVGLAGRTILTHSGRGFAGKLAVMSAVVGVLLLVTLHPEVFGNVRTWFGSGQKETGEGNGPKTHREQMSSISDNGSAAELLTPSSNHTALASRSSPALTNVLLLTLLADDSGKPIPNVPLEIQCTTQGKTLRPKAATDRLGLCEVPLVSDLVELQITTRIEGFADTRLVWNTARGQMIPGAYTLRLVRAVEIGGRVLDPEGKPLPGATVGWNYGEGIVFGTSVESHNFSYIKAQTDHQGRWRINRMAPDVIAQIMGSAEHPDYAPASAGPDPEKTLRAGTHIFRMLRAVTVRGVVLDPDGNTVAGATVTCGPKAFSDSRFSLSVEDGTFLIKGVPLGETTLTAEAEGFAANTISIIAAADGPSHTLKLQRGQTIRIRVLGHTGEPLSRAAVSLNTLAQTQNSERKETPPVQTEFERLTDETGRVTWDRAPAGDLEFDIWAEGHMGRRELKVRPSEQEHVVILKRELTVTGIVQDASTGKDIPKFRVIAGWPTPQGAKWSPFDRDWLTYEGGNFKRTFRDSLVGTENPGYILKIEGEGYAPFITRVIAPDEGIVQVEALLRPATAPLVTVLLPNGNPALQADVGLIYPNSRLHLKSGGFYREPYQPQEALSSTDSKGQFRLPEPDGISQVIVTHPEGCVVTTPTALFTDPVLYLQPWGKIEGTYRKGGKPVEGEGFLLAFSLAQDGELRYSHMHSVKTDAQGRFTFAQVLPGTHRLMRAIVRKEDGHNTYTSVNVQRVEVESGETTTLDIGSDVYVVHARLAPPGGPAVKSDVHISGHIHDQGSLPPDEIVNDHAAVAEWYKTSVNRTGGGRVFSLVQQPDGTFHAEEVPPGAYTARFLGIEKKPGLVNFIWIGRKDFVVAGDAPTRTIDIGEITPEVLETKPLQP